VTRGDREAAISDEARAPTDTPLARLRAATVRTYRVADPASRRRTVVKTGVQLVAVWAFALAGLPAAAVRVERHLGIPRWQARGRTGPAVALFAAGSTLGIASAWVMATEGRGTPIPFDAARDLVVAGPYQVVRNPMAVAAIGQSAGVALWLGSPTAALIPIAGAVVWNQLIRPTEEDFLRDRFGEDYRRYQRAVRCWLPTWPPYDLSAQPAGDAVTADPG